MTSRRYKQLQDAIDNYNKIAWDCREILKTNYALDKILPPSGKVIFEKMMENLHYAELTELILKNEIKYEKQI